MRFPKIVDATVRFGAFMYPTVRFGTVFRNLTVRFGAVFRYYCNPTVRFGAVIYSTVQFGAVFKNRKSYGPVRCDFQKS